MFSSKREICDGRSKRPPWSALKLNFGHKARRRIKAA
jgi:hypothetical protein